jgi:hypothetical protein
MNYEIWRLDSNLWHLAYLEMNEIHLNSVCKENIIFEA